MFAAMLAVMGVEIDVPVLRFLPVPPSEIGQSDPTSRPGSDLVRLEQG